VTGAVATAAVEDRVRPSGWVDVRLLGYVAVVDVVFVAGVLVPYLTRADHPTTGVPAWLGYPALASLFLLPMVVVSVGVITASRLSTEGGRRGVALATVALAVAGFATYVAPVGVSAVRWFLD
jgi:hypothetical protein